MQYRGFRERRFQIVALFDRDHRKIGQTHAGLVIRPITDLPAAAGALNLALAILCVPAEAAQGVADRIVASGIAGILNFAPCPLNVPSAVSVVAVDLSVQLEHLAYKVQNTTPRDAWRRR